MSNGTIRWDRTSIRRQIITRLVEHGGGDVDVLEAAKDVDPIQDVAVDSLHMVEIVLELEEDLAISIPQAAITPRLMRSVNKFADYLEGRVNKGKQHE